MVFIICTIAFPPQYREACKILFLVISHTENMVDRNEVEKHF